MGASDKSPARNVTTPSLAASAIIATQVAIPNVVGMIQSSAESIIGSTCLTVGNVTPSYSNTVAPGNVINQTPNEESTATLGATVNLVVSQGIDPAQPPIISSTSIADDQSGISVVANTSSAIVDDTTLTITSAGGIDAWVYEPFNFTAGGLNGKSSSTEVGLTGTWNASTSAQVIGLGDLWQPLDPRLHFDLRLGF